ncbi:hypothetical protein LNTAR_01275 [Lentisphaera araneosa HTCC2155]|uniref:Neutral/alkaline non-lysosomal ceramidase N-terminal domain-containing protein n=1 Tax=Lentisphaera araneosa HTCC2155 TaxID=313628 RepID=A6DKU2_9BACT|nr:hypothetical protein [Lentisphaera araneosa]EDM27990.1 hypothetical protein LNTAR_01275 [Lentisphaera araneosa HTCC2155]
MNFDFTDPQGFSGSIGVARRDITPPLGIYSRCWGAAKFDCAVGIHRPFTVTAMVCEADDDLGPFALLAFDGFLWSDPEDEWLCRQAVIEHLKTDQSRVIISVSHSHAAVQLTRDNKNKPGGEFIEPYIQHLKEQFVEVSLEARERVQKSKLDWIVSRCDLATNRDLKTPEENRFVVGYNPDKKVDDTVLVGRVSNREGMVCGVLVNYACHPTTLAWENDHLSPDYVGALRESIEEQYPEALSMFLIGACGDLAPAHQYVGDLEVADKHGRRLAYSVLQALESSAPAHQLYLKEIKESGAPLAVWDSQVIDFPNHSQALKCEVPIKIKKEWLDITAIENELAATDDRVLQERLLRKLRVRKSLNNVENFTLNAWVWRLGDVIIVGSSAEHYSWLQVSLRQEFPHLPILVLNLINGANGYLPEKELYQQDIYSVWQTPFAEGGLESMKEIMVEKINFLLSGKM